jgi:hypothetical protein
MIFALFYNGFYCFCSFPLVLQHFSVIFGRKNVRNSNRTCARTAAAAPAAATATTAEQQLQQRRQQLQQHTARG